MNKLNKPVAALIFRNLSYLVLSKQNATRPINTGMNYSFESWHRRRRNLEPEADRVVPLIAAAGSNGMNRKQLGSALDLDRDVLDELLDGLVSAGLLSMAWENGVPVFRTQDGRG